MRATSATQGKASLEDEFKSAALKAVKKTLLGGGTPALDDRREKMRQAAESRLAATSGGSAATSALSSPLLSLPSVPTHLPFSPAAASSDEEATKDKAATNIVTHMKGLVQRRKFKKRQQFNTEMYGHMRGKSYKQIVSPWCGEWNEIYTTKVSKVSDRINEFKLEFREKSSGYNFVVYKYIGDINKLINQLIHVIPNERGPNRIKQRLTDIQSNIKVKKLENVESFITLLIRCKSLFKHPFVQDFLNDDRDRTKISQDVKKVKSIFSRTTAPQTQSEFCNVEGLDKCQRFSSAEMITKLNLRSINFPFSFTTHYIVQVTQGIPAWNNGPYLIKKKPQEFAVIKNQIIQNIKHPHNVLTLTLTRTQKKYSDKIESIKTVDELLKMMLECNKICLMEDVQMFLIGYPLSEGEIRQVKEHMKKQPEHPRSVAIPVLASGSNTGAVRLSALPIARAATDTIRREVPDASHAAHALSIDGSRAVSRAATDVTAAATDMRWRPRAASASTLGRSPMRTPMSTLDTSRQRSSETGGAFGPETSFIDTESIGDPENSSTDSSSSSLSSHIENTLSSYDDEISSAGRQSSRRDSRSDNRTAQNHEDDGCQDRIQKLERELQQCKSQRKGSLQKKPSESANPQYKQSYQLENICDSRGRGISLYNRLWCTEGKTRPANHSEVQAINYYKKDQRPFTLSQSMWGPRKNLYIEVEKNRNNELVVNTYRCKFKDFEGCKRQTINLIDRKKVLD